MRTLVFFSLALSGCNCGSRISGVSSELVAEPSVVDFGTLAPSATATRSLVVRNSSRSALVISSETISGPNGTQFVATSPPVGKLRAGEDATVTITFTAPATPNTLAHAELVFESDAVNARMTVLLYGASAGLVTATDGGAVMDAGRVDAGASAVDAGNPDAGCTPRTCEQATAQCGAVSDLCGGQLQCGECTLPEVCGVTRPNVCGAPSSCSFGTVQAPAMAGPSSTCALRMPPAAGIPCDIPTPGTQFYVNATTGDDNHDGLTPTTAWQSLGKAVCSATPGGTVRVAAGVYLTAEIPIARPLTIKGGYDSTFTSWNPDVHHSIIAGRPRLSDDGAVLGGFRIIRHTNDHGAVFVTGGTLIRNYVELLLDATPLGGGHEGTWHTSYGIIAAAETGKHVTLACNDVYGRNIPTPGARGPSQRLLGLIELGNKAVHNGDTVIHSNRVCLDSYQGSYASTVVGGYGSCDLTSTATVSLTNNVLEGRTEGTTAIGFHGCQNKLFVTATNNTLLSTEFGLQGRDGQSSRGSAPVPTQWRLTNNVFAGLASSSEAIDVQGAVSLVLSAEGNLAFGFMSNAPSPLPALSNSNDFSGSSSLANTFVNWANGDFRPRQTGAATSGGINVWGDGAYGQVTHDLHQQSRPDAGAWVRGALLP